jgi:hypothetical protein
MTLDGRFHGCDRSAIRGRSRRGSVEGRGVAAPEMMPLDLVAWALFRRGRSAEEVAEQTGLDAEQAVEAIIRGFRLTLEED